MQETQKRSVLSDWMTVDEYAKQEGITKWGVHNRIGAKIISPKDVIVFPQKVKILIRKRKKKEKANMSHLDQKTSQNAKFEA